MDDDWNDRMDAYERKLSPFGKFVYRTERRIQRYDLRAKLAEAKARAAASRAKAARKGRSRRRSGPAAPPSTSTPCSSRGRSTRG
jgi:hypothetical protein